MLKSILTKLVGDPNERELKRVKPIVDEINALESKLERLTHEELQDKTTKCRGRLHAYL